MKQPKMNMHFFDIKEAERNFDSSTNHVVGYARLSFDEDGEGFCSIVNQKDLLESVYNNGLKTDNSTYTFLADDGISGYKFNRPQLDELYRLIEQGECNTIIAKDLSRIGRHGALTQYFIEECERVGIRIYAMDDYDSHKESDDLILGIKTWSNERYVKDASQKVRKIIRHKQENGTWLCSVPFGYTVDDFKHPVIKIDKQAADTVERIFRMYSDGKGVNLIARELTKQSVSTPNMYLREKALSSGKEFKKPYSTNWTANCVSSILHNDFYIGNLRQNKYRRKGINGSDVRTKESEQIVFENHHEPIISVELWQEVQTKMEEHKKENYRNKGVEHLFHGKLYCGDCGSLLYCYSRKGLATQYICSQNFRFGKDACTRHRIKESLLLDITVAYLKMIRDNCKELLLSANKEIRTAKNKEADIAKENERIEKELKKADDELVTIEEQRVLQIMEHPDRTKTINLTYDKLYDSVMARIESLNARKKEIEGLAKNIEEQTSKALSALDVFNDLIEHKEKIVRKDIEAIFDKIIVYENGFVKVFLKPYLKVIDKKDSIGIEDKAKNRLTENYDVVTNKVGEGDPSHTTFVDKLAGVNFACEIMTRANKYKELAESKK